MKLNTFSEAVVDYERITGETFTYKPDENQHLKILPSNEWLIWAVQEREGLRYLWLDQSYGFMKSFIPYLLEVMELNNLEWIVTATTRNPKAHMRKWKMERLPQYDYEYQGRRYYILIGHKTNLR